MAKSITFNVETKEEFFIDGDENRVIKLDTHDINLVNRLTDAIPKMQALDKRWSALTEAANVLQETEDIEDTLEDVNKFSETLKGIEKEIRTILDETFDSPGMSDTILGDSSAFSPVNGKFKYEQIIDVLVGLYESDIKKEADKFNRTKVKKKTAKYIR